MTTPIGPILDVTLRTLDCGCVCDDADAIWSPCRQIADTHAEAVAAVRAGVTEPDLRRTDRRRRADKIWDSEAQAWTVPSSPPLTLRDRLDDMARHVRRGE